MQFLPAGKKLILGSGSPRRRQLLTDLKIPFEVRVKKINEIYPSHLKREEIAEYLASEKANAHLEEIANDEIILTSDTVVWCSEKSLEKASNEEEALQMLRDLSGKTHEVISSVCLLSKEKRIVFNDVVKVHFRKLDKEEMKYYVKNYKPFDKAGAYGIQEWIGMIGITGIEGSYFTVMGLPTHLVAEKLREFKK